MVKYGAIQGLLFMVSLSTEVSKIKGLPKNFSSRLKKLKIENIGDLLWHFPTRYEDFSKITKITSLEPGQTTTVQGTIKKVSSRRTWKKRMTIIEAVITDETGGIKAVWFNQPYISKSLRTGEHANFAGKVSLAEDGSIYLSSPIFENAYGKSGHKHTAGIIPIYPETRGLTSKGLRYLIQPILRHIEEVPDFIPELILEEYSLPKLTIAIQDIHFPKSITKAEEASRRFAFEDLFLLQLNNLRLRSRLAKEKAPPLKISETDLASIMEHLPFELTDSQKQSLEEILSDISSTKPMNRLLQGDVGSGKTVVAAIAALVSSQNNKQAAFMAPTEVLARQHYKTLADLFGHTPDISIGFLVGSEARAFYGKELEEKVAKNKLVEEIEKGKIKIIVGTHALIASKKTSSINKSQKGIAFHDLGLVVIDEQHRFGVEQRSSLVKQEKSPGNETTIHFLSMSATPIPRTLSLTLFGDLDLSIIDELPKGRKPIITKVVAPLNRNKAYAFIREQIKRGRQAFVICPRIAAPDESQNEPHSDEAGSPLTDRSKSWAEVKTVKEEYERLSKKTFPELKIAMLHGKIRASEKKEIMDDFTGKKTDILVSTSVIEVGVDIPNATIMIIEGADRFGLAQLYQFRGRVGRGKHQSFCLLFTDSGSDTVQKRLKALLTAKNGFELAEKDLAIRGPGQFLGEKQTGLPDIAMNSLNNIELIKNTRSAARKVLADDLELKNYPALKEKLKSFEKKIHLE
jgi:ATP-dependent DNA helicase RecG